MGVVAVAATVVQMVLDVGWVDSSKVGGGH